MLISPGWRGHGRGWKAVLKGSWQRMVRANLGLAAAGVAFYGFVAIAPMLAALVMVYGLVASPDRVVEDFARLTTIVPREAAELIGQQLAGAVDSPRAQTGLGLAVALGVALFGARNGAGAVITALNIAYEREEHRSFLRVNLLALALTGVGVFATGAGFGLIGAMTGLASSWAASSELAEGAVRLGGYGIMVLAGAAGAATLYRYAPAHENARWAWLTPGSILAALLWMAMSVAFGVYVSTLGNYGATYGALSAVVVLLLWLYLTSYALLIGGALNATLDAFEAEASVGSRRMTDGTTSVDEATR